jgi:hypothetical protein
MRDELAAILAGRSWTGKPLADFRTEVFSDAGGKQRLCAPT